MKIHSEIGCSCGLDAVPMPSHHKIRPELRAEVTNCSGRPDNGESNKEIYFCSVMSMITNMEQHRKVFST